MATDWLAGNESELMKTCEKWTNTLGREENVTAYEWKMSECVDTLQKITAFTSAYDAFNANDSSMNRIVKNEAKEAAKKSMRSFANTSIRFNRLVDDTMRYFLGIKLRDTVPTNHPRPSSQPETLVETTANRFEHRLKALNREGRELTKPADAYGVRYAWQIGGEGPVTGADLPKSKFSRKTTLVVTYTEADKGKQVWYASCYENAKGDGGPWSPLIQAYIW